MAVESATYISQLDATKPSGSDSKAEGDDQLRLLKSTLKNTFPNFTPAALSATQAQLDKLVVSVVPNASAPAGSIGIDANGQVGIGTASPAYPLDIRAAEPYVSVRKPSANSNFYGYNIMAGTDIVSSWLLNATSGQVQFTAGYTGFGGFFTFNTNGLETLRLGSGGEIYAPRVGTTASAANAVLNSGSTPANQLLRSTSSIRYKTDVRDLPASYKDAVLQLRPVVYKSNAPADDQSLDWIGLIAEEVATVLPRMVNYTTLTAGGPLVADGVQYERLSVLLLAIVQGQAAEMSSLKSRVAALEAQ